MPLKQQCIPAGYISPLESTSFSVPWLNKNTIANYIIIYQHTKQIGIEPMTQTCGPALPTELLLHVYNSLNYTYTQYACVFNRLVMS